MRKQRRRSADQRLCFRYIDSKFPLLPKLKVQASSHLLKQYSPVCGGPGRKPRRTGFSQRGSFKPYYDNTPMQYAANFHGCKNDNFQPKSCYFSSFCMVETWSEKLEIYQKINIFSTF